MQEESRHDRVGDARGPEFAGEISDEDLRRIVAQATSQLPRGRWLSRRVLWAIAAAILTVGATIGSIVGQGISYRQMRAVEAIAETLARGACAK